LIAEGYQLRIDGGTRRGRTKKVGGKFEEVFIGNNQDPSISPPLPPLPTLPPLPIGIATKTSADLKMSAEEKEQAIMWAESLTIADVVLTENKLDVYTLGGKEWGPLRRYIKLAFILKNNIIVPQFLRKDDRLGKVVSNHINPLHCPLPTNLQKYQSPKTIDLRDYVICLASTSSYTTGSFQNKGVLKQMSMYWLLSLVLNVRDSKQKKETSPSRIIGLRC